MSAKNSLVDSYKTRTPIVDGRVGHLTKEQEQRLKQLWSKLLAHFETTSGKAIPVLDDPFGVGKQACLDDTPEALAAWYAANTRRVEDARYRTVSDDLYLSGKREAIVPKDFKPLFGDKPSERSFRNAFWQAAMTHRHPDSLLLGYLVVSDWDVQKAFDAVAATVKWRATHAIDRLMWEGESTQNLRFLERALDYSAGNDKLGCPIIVARSRKYTPKEICNEVWEKRSIFLLERTTLIARASGKKTLIINDLTGFGMSNIDYSASKDSLDKHSTHYPDLYQLLILHVNSRLFSGVWKVVSKLLDPVTTSRVQMTRSLDELRVFIDDDHISSDMGGGNEVDLVYKYPTREENAKMFDTQGRVAAEKAFVDAVDAFEAGTRAWCSNGDIPARDELAARLYSAVIELDPYIRSRFLLERQGKM